MGAISSLIGGGISELLSDLSPQPSGMGPQSAAHPRLGADTATVVLGRSSSAPRRRHMTPMESEAMGSMPPPFGQARQRQHSPPPWEHVVVPANSLVNSPDGTKNGFLGAVGLNGYTG